MTKRIMAVAFVAVSMLGVRAAHAQGEAVELVRAGTIGGPVENSLIGSGFVIIVTGQPNDDGTHTAIFKKQDSPAQQVDIASYDELLPADVLRDLIDLGSDPVTGENLYLAFVEW